MIGLQGNVKRGFQKRMGSLELPPLSKQNRHCFSLYKPLFYICCLSHSLTYHDQHRLLRMGWLKSPFSSLRKLWRLHSTQKKRRGIYILYEGVKSCPYEDVHVLWSMLVDSRPPPLPSPK